MARQVEEEAADGVVGVVERRAVHAEVGQQVEEGALPVDQAAAVLARDDVGLLLAVGNLAHERLEDILEGDDAPREAELVEDHAVAELLVAQLLEGAVDLEPLVEELDRFEVPFERKAGLVEVLEELLEVDHADERVEAAPAHGVAVVGMGVHHGADFIGRHSDLEPRQFAAGRHDGFDPAVAQREDAPDDFLLDLLHLALLGPLADDGANLLLGDAAPGLLDAQQTGDARRAA